MTPAKKKPKPLDPIEEWFMPIVMYKNEDGTTEHYPVNAGQAWLGLDRAISSCFGSISKRLRSYYKGARPVYAVLRVLRVHDNKNVWGPVRIPLNIKRL